MVALLRSDIQNEVNSSAEFVVHNSSAGQLIRAEYKLDDIESIISVLGKRHTLSIVRLPNGGSTAVTITDAASLASALGDNLINGWDRDSDLQAYAELSVASDIKIARRLKIDACAWKRGLNWSLWHHRVNQDLFIHILDNSAPADGSNYPAVRVNPETGLPPNGSWNHKQHDALGLTLHLLFWQLNQQNLSWADQKLKSLALPYATLLFNLFEKVGVWSEPDDSAWEFFNTGLHLSSLGIVVLALEELLEFLNANAPLDYLSYRVTPEDVTKMIGKCKDTLQMIGSRESVWSGGSRDCDLAQLNALLVQAVSQRWIFSEVLVEEILKRIEDTLVGRHGVRRFAGDVWNGRQNADYTVPGEEAQWSHGAPMLSVIYGSLYLRTKQSRFLEKQQLYFSRTLAGIDFDWRLPEAYILEKEQMKWIADANKPLAWSQSMFILALTAMKSSLLQKESASSTATTDSSWK